MSLLQTLGAVCDHPLNRSARLAALWRFGRWQLSQRVFPRRVVTPWVGDTRLVVGMGETGLTGNIYCGLHEFADMAFVLHYLRAADRFVDVGANAGSYTVLAAGVAGATTLALEPVRSTYERLLDNVNVNRLGARVEALHLGAGAQAGELRFTCGADTMNHALADDEASDTAISVAISRLDDLVPRDRNTFIKIDVEGFESAVISGARELLGSGVVSGLLVEMNGSAARYGFSDEALRVTLEGHGLRAWTYSPFERALAPMSQVPQGNVLFLRDVDAARARVRTAPPARVLGRLI